MTNKDLESEDIKKLIPHREPMLIIDKITNIVPFISATGIKHVTKKENFFEGHFPNKPIMPGGFIIEALAQTASVLVMHSMNLTSKNKLVYFMSIENAKFRKPVLPDSVLYLNVMKKQERGLVWKFSGEAEVNKFKVADAVFSAMIVK